VPQLRALVRSKRAAESLADVVSGEPPEVVIADYQDVEAVTRAARGCHHIVHLVGILKEGSHSRYEDAHENACRTLAAAAERVAARRIVYLSIFGSHPDSNNPCLASKGRAEEILREGRTPVSVLRVPMVIGPEDFASASLRSDARSRIVPLLGAGVTLQQPIDSRDVVRAILKALEQSDDRSLALDLGGPERITGRALVERAAELYGRRPLILPIPIALARGAVRLIERLLSDPPITSAMLDVLQQDDRIDEDTACKALDLTLTPLDETLRSFVGPDASSHA
jgi:NADH dehydrogenase